MTCKDCIYYEVCADFRRNICDTDRKRFEEYRLNSDGLCDNFKDKNAVIVPPCKVGDIVYVCFSRTRVIECKVAQIIIENIEEIGMSFICYGGMRFDMRHWGKTVFLTREEAERALEGKT